MEPIRTTDELADLILEVEGHAAGAAVAPEVIIPPHVQQEGTRAYLTVFRVTGIRIGRNTYKPNRTLFLFDAEAIPLLSNGTIKPLKTAPQDERTAAVWAALAGETTTLPGGIAPVGQATDLLPVFPGFKELGRHDPPITTLHQVVNMTDAQLLEVRGVGPATVREMRTAQVILLA